MFFNNVIWKMIGKCICYDYIGKDNDREYIYVIMGIRKKLFFRVKNSIIRDLDICNCVLEYWFSGYR